MPCASRLVSQKMVDQTNPVLKAIRDRRSIIRFETSPIDEEKIQDILDAGRWAPSWLNKQPWKFIAVKDQKTKTRISEFVPTIFNLCVKEAPVCIAVCVNPKEDPFHYIEDGAAATQNMALAAHSLGLGSCWIGVFDLKGDRNSSEVKIRKILQVPKPFRLLSLLPIGMLKLVPEKERKQLSEFVYNERFP